MFQWEYKKKKIPQIFRSEDTRETDLPLADREWLCSLKEQVDVKYQNKRECAYGHVSVSVAVSKL